MDKVKNTTKKKNKQLIRELEIINSLLVQKLDMVKRILNAPIYVSDDIRERINETLNTINDKTVQQETKEKIAETLSRKTGEEWKVK